MNYLGVFAKFWQPSAVKTRLGQEIGFEAAAELYREMLQTTLNRCSSLADTRSVAFTPPERVGEFVALAGSDWNCVPQAAGDLGVRMAAFAADSLASGAHRVVIIGSDCPHLPTEWVQDAFEHLHDYDVVLGPSCDGGYYLVGFRDDVPPIFSDIQWSTPNVFSQTVARLVNSDLSFAVLGETFDVDDLASLHDLEDLLRRNDRNVALEWLSAAVKSALGRR